MQFRHVLVIAWLACPGCYCGELVPSPARQIDTAANDDPLWEKGQLAMHEGQAEQANPFFADSLAANPAKVHNHLSLAAACLECGRQEAAATHLAQYLDYNPDHALVRGYYAELLWKLQRPADAQAEFARFLALAFQTEETDRRRLIHAHSRLMELADTDAYSRYLHRGLGLFWLACCRADLPDQDGTLAVESLLVKSAADLQQAHELRPDQAQPCWYLFRLWHQLGQPYTAKRWLNHAQAAGPFSYLTPAEQRSLHLTLSNFRLSIFDF